MYFWVIFQQLKKKYMLKKCSRNRFGLLPNCIGKKKLYCNLAIVLQERGLEKKNCIAIVLQEKGVVGLG